jgi:hypothetical protein
MEGDGRGWKGKNLITSFSVLPSSVGPHAGLCHQGKRPKPVEATITVSHIYSLTFARYANVVVAVPCTLHCPANYKIKIHYLR